MRSFPWMLVIIIASLMAVGCGPGEPDPKDLDLSAELAVVEEARAAWDEAWQKLQDLEAEQKELKGKTRPTAEERTRLAELDTEIKAARELADELFTADDEALTGFLNKWVNDAPTNPAVLRGLRLYADKAIRNADTFMTASGNYVRAIEILQNASRIFEDVGEEVPEDLTEALGMAREYRYLSKERFDQIARRMTEDEVRAITGTPNFHNVREGESGGRKIITWLFQRADGEVAAVYFHNGRVYQMTWQVQR